MPGGGVFRRAEYGRSGRQLELVKAVYETGTPVVAAENDAPADSLVFSVMGTFGALVISNSAAGAEHAEGDALSAAERAALSLHGATYGLEGVSPARVESLEACQDGELAENGLCVWAIIWKQALVFGECDERA